MQQVVKTIKVCRYVHGGGGGGGGGININDKSSA